MEGRPPCRPIILGTRQSASLQTIAGGTVAAQKTRRSKFDQGMSIRGELPPHACTIDEAAATGAVAVGKIAKRFVARTGAGISGTGGLWLDANVGKNGPPFDASWTKSCGIGAIFRI